MRLAAGPGPLPVSGDTQASVEACFAGVSSLSIKLVDRYLFLKHRQVYKRLCCLILLMQSLLIIKE